MPSPGAWPEEAQIRLFEALSIPKLLCDAFGRFSFNESPPRILQTSCVVWDANSILVKPNLPSLIFCTCKSLVRELKSLSVLDIARVLLLRVGTQKTHEQTEDHDAGRSLQSSTTCCTRKRFSLSITR